MSAHARHVLSRAAFAALCTPVAFAFAFIWTGDWRWVWSALVMLAFAAVLGVVLVGTDPDSQADAAARRAERRQSREGW